MSSLYNISQELLNIFEELEENGGELTPELENRLTISREEYASKLENYAMALNQFKADIRAIKEEKDRLDKRKKTLENRIEKLEHNMLEAINKFGGIETSLFKIGTRNTKSTELDLYRIDKLNRELFKFAREIHSNGIIAFGEDCDVQGMLEVINANVKAELAPNDDTEFIPYTIDDLSAIKVNINSDSSLLDLFTKKDGMLEAVLNNEMYFNIENGCSKTDMKQHIDANENITVAKTKYDTKLSIR